MRYVSQPAQTTANWGDEKLIGLIVAFLADEDDSQLILADLLEERGDDLNANRARKILDYREHRQLDFALKVMPYRAVLVAGCGFAENILRQNWSARPFQMLRNWLLNPELAGEFRDAERILRNCKLPKGFVGVGSVLECYCANVLAAAANQAFAAMLQETNYRRQGMPSTASEHENNVKHFVSRISIYCREAAAAKDRAAHQERPWWRTTGRKYPGLEASWQVRYTIGILTGLVALT